MIALIDGDSIIYKVACALEEKIDWDNDGEVSYYSNLPEQRKSIMTMIKGILKATDCDSYEIWLSSSSNFRYDNPLGYKTNRTDIRKPTDFHILRKFVEDNPNCKISDNMEADDVVVYKKTTFPDNYILCAIDKDVLYQTEGTHFNYGSNEFITVSKIDAIRFGYYQCLVGDPTDGYKGCKGIGKVKASKALDDITDEIEMWNIVLDLYDKAGQTEEDAINTMRLASMHQYNGEVINLWTPPHL